MFADAYLRSILAALIAADQSTVQSIETVFAVQIIRRTLNTK